MKPSSSSITVNSVSRSITRFATSAIRKATGYSDSMSWSDRSFT